MNSLYFEGMYGLGDNIYQYPIIKTFSDNGRPVYLRTPWPQLYQNLPGVQLVAPSTRLRTQNQNVIRNIRTFVPAPNLPAIRLSYTPMLSRGIPFHQGLLISAGLKGAEYFLRLRKKADKRDAVAVIRPPTLRREWMAAARNPRSEYIQKSIYLVRALGLKTIVVADVNGKDEIYDGPRPEADVYYERGELDLLDIMDLFHTARVVIGGVGFIAPMAIGLGTPALIIHGGAGGVNRPEMIDCPGEGKLFHVLPERHCLCTNNSHQCDKTIDDKKLIKALNQLLLF